MFKVGGFKQVLACSLTAAAAIGVIQKGKCPAYWIQKPSVDEFQIEHMNGLWYEYVWDPEFAFNYNYMCSMWLFQDYGTGIMNNMVNAPVEEDGGIGNLILNIQPHWAEPNDHGHQYASFLYERH